MLGLYIQSLIYLFWNGNSSLIGDKMTVINNNIDFMVGGNIGIFIGFLASILFNPGPHILWVFPVIVIIGYALIYFIKRLIRLYT